MTTNLQDAPLEQALEVLTAETDRLWWGRAITDYAFVLFAQGDQVSARQVALEAVTKLPPTFVPVEAVRAARTAGSICADCEEWSDAADAYLIAVMGREFLRRRRISVEDRRLETEWSVNITRWAAFALAQTGKSLEAVQVLDAGRAQELLGSTKEMGIAVEPPVRPPAGRTALPGPLQDRETSRPEDVLAEIRTVPGFEDFDFVTPVDVLRSAVEPKWPLVYVNPTPWGTSFLLVAADGDELRIESVTHDAPTSGQALQVLAGGDLEYGPATQSYLGAAYGTRADGVAEAVDRLIPWLAEHISRPIANLLRSSNATGATLLISGPLALAPIHAALWTEDGRDLCLLDIACIGHAPSAGLHALSLQRAQAASGRDRCLLALGNPSGAGLPASEAEVYEIARFFENAYVATGPDATRNFLEAKAADATHLHFACHGRGSPLTLGESGIQLADGELLAEEIKRDRAPRRLTVVSACQTAVTSMDLAEEVFSIGTALLAADTG